MSENDSNSSDRPSLRVTRKVKNAERKSSNLGGKEESGAWYKTGFGNVPPPMPRKEKTTWRFWIPYGEERDIIFLDEDPFIVAEHSCKLEGRWGHVYTCLTGVDPKGCPLCDELKSNDKALISRSYPPVSCFTILDSKPWVDRDKNTHNWSTRLLAAKQVPSSLLAKLQNQYGTLLGAVWTVSRLGDKSASTGDSIMFKEWLVDPEQFDTHEQYWAALKDKLGLEETPQQVDYVKELKPKSRKELEAIVFGARNELAAEEITATYQSDIEY